MAEFTLQETCLEDQEITDYFDGGSLKFQIHGADGPLVVTLSLSPEGHDSDPEAVVEKEDFRTGRVVFRSGELTPHFPENSLGFFFVWEFNSLAPANSDPVLRVAGKFRVRPAAKPSITPSAGARPTPTIDSTLITLDSTQFTLDEAA